MRVTRLVALFITLAVPCTMYAQQARNPTPNSQKMEGTVIAADGTQYWSGFKIESGGKEYTFVSQFKAKQGTNPVIVGGKCCAIGTRVEVTYVGSPDRNLLNVTRIVVLESIVGGLFMPNEDGIILVPVPTKPVNAPRPMQTPKPPPIAERGFAGDWSDGTSWLMIINDGDKIRAIYPSAKSPQVLSGSLQHGNQLRLTNNNTGRYFSPFDNYDGDFSREAWVELGPDRNLLTVRFSQARGGRSIVMKRMPEQTPFQVPGARNVLWSTVSVAGTSSCAVTTTGVPYCWGGDYDRIFDSRGAGLVNGLENQTIATVSKSIISTCWVTTNGDAYCNGGSGAASAVPGGVRFTTVSVGENHACGLTLSGEAYCWGSNFERQLGNSTISSRFGGQGETESAVPVAVMGGLRFRTLSAGSRHTCGVTTDGSAYCWGDGSAGQLGNGTISSRGTAVGSTTPVEVAGGLKFASVTASVGYLAGGYTCGIDTIGKAYCWGEGNRQELGSLKTKISPVPVSVDGDLNFTALSAGAHHVCGITTGGEAYCWGSGAFGVLGTGTSKDALTPVPVAGSFKFSSISSGGTSTCGVTTSGGLYCWGSNGYGQLGVPTKTRNSFIPVPVQMQTDEDGFKAFFREFSSAVRKRDRALVESFMSPAIVFPVDIRSTNMAFDYLDYDGGHGWKWLEREVSSGARPYKDSEPRPIARITVDKNAIFGRGSDGRWKWLRFGQARYSDK